MSSFPVVREAYWWSAMPPGGKGGLLVVRDASWWSGWAPGGQGGLLVGSG